MRASGVSPFVHRMSHHPLTLAAGCLCWCFLFVAFALCFCLFPVLQVSGDFLKSSARIRPR